MKIVGLCGSLRKKSLNGFALAKAASMLPAGVEYERIDITGFPLFNQDDQDANGIPAAVQKASDQLRAANALIMAVPEYNWSMPSALKNAIDWISRTKDQPFAGKTIGLMGATIGVFGTARAQLHVRDVMVPLDGRVMNRPPIMIPQAQNKFDAEGNLNDEATEKLIGQFVTALVAAAK